MINILRKLPFVTGLLTVIFLILVWEAAYRDGKERKITDHIVLGVLLVASVNFFVIDESEMISKILGIFAVGVPMLLVTLIRPGAFGGGDIKLMAASGAFLGAADIFLAFFYGLALGSIYGIYLIFFKGKTMKERFAFGPFLAAGITIKLMCTAWAL